MDDKCCIAMTTITRTLVMCFKQTVLFKYLQVKVILNKRSRVINISWKNLHRNFKKKTDMRPLYFKNIHV